ncbi:MAG: ribonuclease III [Hyphomicrobiaceae bacterium]
MKRKRKFVELEKALGYRFKDQDLLVRALTHASTRASARSGSARYDNERLEFLGDRVLGLAMAGVLIDAYPEEAEGQLARRFNRLVNGQTCASIARGIDLGRHLLLSESEASSGGRDKDTILADAMEAVLGAVYRDTNFEKAREVVVGLWTGRLEGMTKVAADPKSALQEWAQGKGMSLPRYVEVDRSGPDHAPRFVSEVRITGCKPARGEGTSKRAAEQAAARALLAREGVIGSPEHDA